MMGWLLSALPRKWLQSALYEQFLRSLPRSEALALRYWGATGNPVHHQFQWADEL